MTFEVSTGTALPSAVQSGDKVPVVRQVAGVWTPYSFDLSTLPGNTLATGARGGVLYVGASGPAYLAPGTSGDVLQTNGSAADPTWVAPSGGGTTYTGTSPIVISGDVISLGQAGATTGQVLGWTGTAWAPTTVSGAPGGTSGQLQDNNGGSFAGVTLSSDFVFSGGNLSINAQSTNSLTAGPGIAGGDEVATYSLSATGDVKYTWTQVATFTSQNAPSWATSGRPSLGSTQYGYGYNTTLLRFDFWNGTAWNQHARISGDTFTGATGVAPAALTYASSIVTNAALANLFTVTLTGNATLANPTNLVAGFFYTWEITQDGTGSRTLGYGTLFSWPGGTAPTLSTAAGAVDAICGFYDGTKLRCAIGKGFA